MVVLLAACGGDMVTAPVDEAFTLRVGDVVSIDGTPLALKFVRVESDTRCPYGAPCPSAPSGNAATVFEAALSGERATFTLNTAGVKDTTIGDYRVELAALNPVPTLAAQISSKEYRASVIVSR